MDVTPDAWPRLDEILEAGYQSARTAVAPWSQRE
jgi:hypothetical protein